MHVHKVMEALATARLHLKLEKCEFHKTEVEYLGIIISTEGIKINQDKVKAVAEWETPANLTNIWSFLRFANFYRRFIKGYNGVVAPMVGPTSTDIAFEWNDECHRYILHASNEKKKKNSI